MIINEIHSSMLNSPVRKFEGRVEVYEGSTLLLTCGCHDHLKNFTIERLGEEGKFFGFGICQKLKVIFIDKNRELNLETGSQYLEVVFGIDGDYVYPCPRFFITEVNRDEETNELSVTAYDDLIVATAYQASDLVIDPPYTLRTFAAAAGAALGLPLNCDSVSGPEFDLVFSEGANLMGTETIRDLLNRIGEATQTIYYVDHDWKLTFKRLDREGAAKLTIDKEMYFTLNSRTNRRISTITHVTELGDNLSATTGVSGSTQFVRDNPFWDLRDDLSILLQEGIERIGGLTINQFDTEWRGNYLLEIGDKIDMVTKDNDVVTSYLLNDSLLFDGALSQHTEWSYADQDIETAETAVNLGTALNHTYAKVDKINRRIDLVASEVTANGESIAALQVNTDSISASVTEIEKTTTEAIEGINGDLETITKKVDATMTSEEVTIQIQKEIDNGVTKVETSTGFTFDENGLTIDRSDSEMKTTVTEDGMTVYRNDEAVLVANNEGVKAEDLHATTYLIIGNYSRFEDYEKNGEARTGCFWIG